MQKRKLGAAEREAIIGVINSKPKSLADLMILNRQFSKKFGVETIRHSDLLLVYREELKQENIIEDKNFERLLRRRAIRTMSGIAPVAVLTKPFACPGKCAYCPTEKDVPQSYLSNEPAVMRAIRCEYEPFVQTDDRLQSLENNGHEPTKIELIVIGGTWSVLPVEYKYWYIANCFAAANAFGKKIRHNKYKISDSLPLDELKKKLLLEQKKNEKAKYQIIGLTLETRPDYINDIELLEMREFGCTRVELGVQAIDDKILKLNKRGHGVKEVAEATKLLRDYGFKVTYHLMPGLPGATTLKDLEMFKTLFSDERFQPDQIKFYPTVVTKGSLLYKWWQDGKYMPYSDEELQKLIVDCKQVVPRYVRIIRLIRDIPGESIVAGNKITNLRQIMQQNKVECNCIRCREAGEVVKTSGSILKVTNYDAAKGKEYFIEFCSKDEKTLFAFCRLRLSSNGKFKHAGLVRELHVYGELVPIGAEKKVQHSGLGRKLLEKAEEITREVARQEMVIISGVGVREYYRKNGYKLSESYMKKKI